MKFVDGLFGLISSGINYIGDMIAKLIEFIAKPLSYIFYYFDGVFYFLYQLFLIISKIIMIFVAILQFFASIVVGFMRSILSMLTIDFNATPINYPSSSYQGIQAVLDIFQPMGVLTVVPMIVLAIVWFYFAKRVIGLIGGIINNA
jgi:hypothetical protein